MNPKIHRILLNATLATAMPATMACGEPTNPQPFEPGATESDGNPTTGAGGSGGIVGCLHFPEEGRIGVAHRCEGDINVVFEADVTGQGHKTVEFSRYFGSPIDLEDPDDNFENPQVMACCEPLDPPLDIFDPDYQEQLANTLHYKACYHDVIEQGCRSLVFHLREIADDLSVGSGQAQALSDWIAEHQQDCRDAFWPTVAEWQYTPAEESLNLSAQWSLPDGAGWPSVDNISIELVPSPFNEIYSVNLPADEADWRICGSQQDNNDNVFAVAADPVDDFVLQSGSADVDGPPIPPSSERIVGSASFKSTSTSCELCSMLSHTPNGSNGKRIDYMLLDTEEAEIGTSAETLVLDRGRVLLYEPVVAPNTGFNKWTVPRNGATFVLSGFAEGEAGIVHAKNTTAIDLKWTTIFGWRTLPFEIEYRDVNNQTWTILVGTLSWD